MSSAIAYSSSFTPKLRTYQAPGNFYAEPLIAGGWPAKRVRFAWAPWGANNAIGALSPYTEVTLTNDNVPIAIRVNADRSNPAVGYMVFYQLPDDLVNPTLWFPCTPENGTNQLFHFGCGDYRLNGQPVLVPTFPQPHYTYQVNGQYFYPRGPLGLEGELVPDPTIAPTITTHGGFSLGTYYVSIAYLLGNGTETPRTPPQAVLLAANNERAILLHRNENVPHGVVGIVVYVGLYPLKQYRQPAIVQRNAVTFWIASFDQSTPAAQNPTSASWLSNKPTELLDSNAEVCVIDEDYDDLDAPLVIPYRPDLPLRQLVSDSGRRRLTVVNGFELLTCQDSYFYCTGFAFSGPNTKQGLNFCDPSGGENFFVHFERCSFIPGPNAAYWLLIDDIGTNVPVGQPIYVAGHTASEVWFTQCYAQREGYISGNQSVDIFFDQHRQDTGNSSIETADFHLRNNKFVVFRQLWCDNSAHALIDMHNEAGPLVVSLENCFIDKHKPLIVKKGQNEPGKLLLSVGNLNRETGAQSLAHAPNGPLTIELRAFLHQTSRIYGGNIGTVKVYSLDPSEAAALTIVGLATFTEDTTMAFDAGPAYTPNRFNVNNADMTGGTIITNAPAATQLLINDDLVITTDTAMNVTIQEETTNTVLLGPIYVSANFPTQITMRDGNCVTATRGKRLVAVASVTGHISVTTNSHFID